MPEKQTAIAVTAEMNECLKLGSGKRRANVRYWVFLGTGLRSVASGLTRLVCRHAWDFGRYRY